VCVCVCVNAAAYAHVYVRMEKKSGSEKKKERTGMPSGGGKLRGWRATEEGRKSPASEREGRERKRKRERERERDTRAHIPFVCTARSCLAPARISTARPRGFVFH